MNDYIGEGVCKYCGKQYHQETPFHLFCSKKCYNAWETAHLGKKAIIEYVQPFTFECGGCGKTVTVYPGNDYRYKYCSKMCFFKAKEERKRRKKDPRKQCILGAQHMESYEKWTNEQWGGS